MSKINCIYANSGIHLLHDKLFKPCCQSTDFPSISSNEYTIQEAYNHIYFSKLRENLKNGIKDPICQRCWNDEEKGIKSLRQTQLENYPELENVQSEKIKFLEISLSNICNYKCRTCYPRDSTKWAKEFYDLDNTKTYSSYKQYKKSVTYLENSNSNLILNLIKYGLEDLEYITFFGGEPFLLSDLIFKNILEEAVKNNYSKNINLAFTTNGSVWNDNYIDILSQFKTCNIFVSIDGINQRFNYIRHPGNWDIVDQNLKKMIAIKSLNISLVCTISIYNSLYIDEVVEYAKNLKVPIHFNTVQHPDYLNIQNLPFDIKQFIQKNNSNEYQEVIDFMLKNETNYEKWDKFLLDYKKRDHYRKESLLETFPLFKKFIK